MISTGFILGKIERDEAYSGFERHIPFVRTTTGHDVGSNMAICVLWLGSYIYFGAHKGGPLIFYF